MKFEGFVKTVEIMVRAQGRATSELEYMSHLGITYGEA